jgi:hypothetical protein
MADLKQLMAMMGISSANPSMGGGMVGQAAQKLGGRGYHSGQKAYWPYELSGAVRMQKHERVLQVRVWL